jgi:hypothetical protein
MFIAVYLLSSQLKLIINVLSTYLPLFMPIFNVTYQELTNQEKQLMLFDAPPKDYIDQIKRQIKCL